MQLLSFAQQIGLQPKKAASTHGGEYHSPCPNCGGSDRFILWPQRGRYWCRRCNISGDLKKFCQQFLNAPYPILDKFVSHSGQQTSVTAWQERAESFTSSAHSRLIYDPQAMQHVLNRGLKTESIYRFKIGWNPINRFDDMQDWGFESILNEEGHNRKIWLPKGIVLPTFFKQHLQKIKIRRVDWSMNDSRPKYIEVKGSEPVLSFFEYSPLKPIVLVESEIDAMTICQEAADLCGSVALGGSSKKPQLNEKALLLHSPLLLFALDFDQAGKSVYPWWKQHFSKLLAWPTPYEKSPGDAFKKGLDLRKWVNSGIEEGDKYLQLSLQCDNCSRVISRKSPLA